MMAQNVSGKFQFSSFFAHFFSSSSSTRIIECWRVGFPVFRFSLSSAHNGEEGTSRQIQSHELLLLLLLIFSTYFLFSFRADGE